MRWNDAHTWAWRGTVATGTAGSSPEIETLAPHAEASYRLSVTVSMVTQARCRVSWTDARGRQENLATVRLG